jgi:hypothetical protein
VPFGRQGTGRKDDHAALLMISNESSYVNAQTLFVEAGHMPGSCGARLRFSNGSWLAAAVCSAQLSSELPFIPSF